MSERSERIIDTVSFAAQRRTAHWCLVTAWNVDASHDSTVHQ